MEVESVAEVQFYSSKEHLLKRTQVEKALKFVELGKIVYDPNEKCFLCLPIEGYNKTTYSLRRCAANVFSFECDCQGWQTSARKGGVENASCSHVLALHYWFDARNKERGFGRHAENEKIVN